MATAATVYSALKTDVLAAISASAWTSRAVSTDFSISSGSTVARLSMDVIGRLGNDSNTQIEVAVYSVEVLHKLSSINAEEAYITGSMSSDQTILTNTTITSVWRSTSGVYDIVSGPDVGRLDRVGNVLRYDVTVQLAIEP